MTHKSQLISKGLFGEIVWAKNKDFFSRISALASKKEFKSKTLLYDYVC